MRSINLRWMLLTAFVMATPLWAAQRNGVLAPSVVKKEQNELIAKLKSGNKFHIKHKGDRAGESKIMVVSCADSHVDPETIFHLSHSELYTNRAFGNVVDKVILASLEYGATALKCRVLVVLGHTSCSALKEAIAEHDHPTAIWRSLNLKELDGRLQPAVEAVERANKEMKLHMDKTLEGDDKLNAVLRTNILNTMRDIREQSPTLWQLEQDDMVRVLGAIYHKDTGEVEWVKE
jgi:carbonic anhydrase